MSKKQRAIQRRATAQAMPSGGVLIPQHIIAQAMAQMKTNNKTPGNTDLFSPGEPMTPQKGANPNNWPRQFSFPLSANTTSPDRSLQRPDIPSFQQLRNLAELYEGIGLCERVWLDLIPGLQLKIQVKPELQAQGVEIDKYLPRIKAITQLFQKPDGSRNIHSWLRMAIIEQTQIDALCIFKQRDKMGRLQALKIVDGSTIKPILDDWGNVIAYQQFPWNIPGDIFTPDQLIYFVETPRANTPYGKSRVERIMMRINQALRKEKKDLAHFTEGNQPFALMEVPEASNWTPDQIEEFEHMWNSLVAGNEQQQVRVKFTQAGMKYTALEQYQLLSDFDRFILNIATADYGLSMSDLSFTEDIHKSSDQGQQNMLFRRTLGPIVSMYGGILTEIIETDFDEPDLMATFGGYEEENDLKTQAEAYEILINSAVVSPATAAHALKQPQIPETGPLFVTQSGIIPLSNYEEGSEFRKASDDAQLAGFKLAATPQQPQPGQEEKQGDESANTKPGKQVPTTAKSSQDEEEDAKQQKQPLKRAVSDRPAMLQQHTGMMVAFMLDPTIAQQIALPDGEKPEDLHCTLVFMGDMYDPTRPGKLNPVTTLDVLKTALSAFAGGTTPVTGRIGGIGRFVNPNDDTSPIVASINAPGLQEWRRRLVSVLDAAGYYVADDYDFVPHVTLEYVPDDAPMPIDDIPANIYLTFDTLCLAIGDDRYYFPIGTPPVDDGLDMVKERAADLRRWKKRAIEDVKACKTFRGFSTTYIPDALHAQISTSLERCTTVEEVHGVFERATLPVQHWQDFDPLILDAMAKMKANGVVSQTWKCRPGACDDCLLNNNVTVPLHTRFPNGAMTTPCHGNCECTATQNKAVKVHA
jgi:2'-5' RNA ligase